MMKKCLICSKKIIKKDNESKIYFVNKKYCSPKCGYESLRGVGQFCTKGHDTHITGRYVDGHCKKCSKNYSLHWIKNHYKQSKENAVNWKKLNPEKDKIHKRNNKWKYQGIKSKSNEFFTVSDYNKLYQIQQGKCGICKKHATETERNLSVDHNHKTGKVRGLLCIGCNSSLGILENEEFYKKAKIYLNKNV